MIRGFMLLSVVSGLARGVGCGGSTSASPFPQVVNAGGKVLSAPTLVSVTFDADPMATNAEAFVQQLPTSSVWSSGSEYGVVGGSAGTPIRTTLAALGLPSTSVDDSALSAALAAQLEAGSNGFVAPDQAIYVFFLPAGLTITASGQTGCVDFGGYHSAIATSAGPTAYAVVARCTSFNGLDESDGITGVASHEILEAATDPYFQLNGGAWQDVDSADLAFSLAFGGEIGDLCLNSAPAFYTPADLPFVVQRFWSNAAAAAGQDPCLPATTVEPFFQSIPQVGLMPFHVNGGSTIQARALSLAVGQSVTLTVQLYSPDPATEAWSLSTVPISDGVIEAAFDQTTGVGGDEVHLTLSVSEVGSLQGNQNVESIAIVSQLGDRAVAWPILITNP